MQFDYYSNPYFTKSLLSCKCCGKYHFSRLSLLKLIGARTMANIPFNINSAFRCWKHNNAVGGVPDSSHVTGYAVDIRCTTDSTRYTIISALLACGYNRIGVHSKFIHADNDPTKPILVIWFY